MVLVTGGTGLLGSHVLFKLTSENGPIRALYRNPHRKDLVKSVFNYYDPENGSERYKKIEWFKGDILDIASLEEGMKNISLVYHCAGLVSFEKRKFNELMKVNREGTANVVNCCLSSGVEKLCHVSSTAALGGTPTELIKEEVKWKKGPETSGYSISKYSAEKEVWRGIEEGLSAVIVNPSVIFGAGNWEESSLAIFRTVNKGLNFYTTGKNAFVDARDVADIMVQLMNSPIKNERFLCISENLHFKDLVEMIAKQLGKTPPQKAAPEWAMAIVWRMVWLISRLKGNSPTITKESASTAFKSMEYDNSKIIKALNFKFRTIADTIENTVNGRILKT